MHIIIIGAGEVGKSLANMLSQEGKDVALVEAEEELAEKVAASVDALVIKGDATQMQILKDAGIEKADALIAVTTDDKTNLMVCEIAKSVNVERIIARVNQPSNEELFTKLDITSIIPVVGLTVTTIRQLLDFGGERIIAQLGDGEIQVVELRVGPKSGIIDKPAVLKGARIGAIYRNGELIIPSADTLLKEGDLLIVVVKSEDLTALKRILAPGSQEG